MVINILPGSEDEKTKISTLNIEGSHGSCLTPNRIINRNDIAAKESLGLNIQLGGPNKLLFYEIPFDMNDVLVLLHNKKIFEKKINSIRDVKDRFQQSGTLFFLGLSLTNEALSNLINSKRVPRFVTRFCSIIKDLELESVHLPDFENIKSVKKIVNGFDLQYIPMIDPKQDKDILNKQLDHFDNFECADSPLLSFKFRTFDKVDSNYKIIKNRIKNWHEKNKAIMVHDAERQLKNCRDVSGIHYSSLMTADLIVPKFSRGFGIKKEDNEIDLTEFMETAISTTPATNWFSTQTLQVSKINQSFKQNLDFTNIEKLVSEDKKILELLERIKNGKLSEIDLKNMRNNYMSKISEYIDSLSEFTKFSKYVEENSVSEYLETKQDMDSVLKSHLTTNKKLDEFIS